MEDKDEIYEYSEKAARKRSIEISQKICKLISEMDVNNESQMKRLRQLFKQQIETLSPLERQFINESDLNRVVKSIESDDISDIHAGLMTSLRILGKFIINIKG
ncbi:hypothetical protein [Vibrio phage Va2]|nr:hypothetical protein [Vibrio phage Va2]